MTWAQINDSDMRHRHFLKSPTCFKSLIHWEKDALLFVFRDKGLNGTFGLNRESGTEYLHSRFNLLIFDNQSSLSLSSLLFEQVLNGFLFWRGARVLISHSLADMKL